ncbi:ribokinase [Texcoconibacillus texcoconensis]|uniref:Ribokinase n=1 Tax=Texcoconibacillus texcoconensis TaxID=1095777 RepID=A0A840QM06_9BACI|nr:ribokinase [Texcoconibacillus texcoconensis]
MESPKVTVIGSANMDLVTSTKRMPNQGETILGNGFDTFPGGKGANQAVAAARLGAEVNFICSVGDDIFGHELLENLKKERIHLPNVKPVTDTPTGVATILLSDGDNRIIVTPGANANVTKETIDKNQDVIQHSDIVLVQMEIPRETVEYVIERCHIWQVPIIVNPAPALHLSAHHWDMATWITPNESEKEALFSESDYHNWKQKMIITRGKQGASYWTDEKEIVVPTENKTVVDTTGAGDTFNGALAVSIAEGKTLEDAIGYANKAASISVTRYGAQGGMPLKEEIGHS